MRWAFVLLVLLACSAVGFQPAECQSLSPDNQGMLHDLLYRDLLRGTYGSDDCFEFRGEVLQSIAGGYVVDTEGWGSSFPGDVFVRWEGDYRFVQGDLVVVTGAVAEPLTFETAIGSQRTIPAFHGSEVLDFQQHDIKKRPTRLIIQATKQAEYLAEYEARTADALQDIQSCANDIVSESRLIGGYLYELVDLDLTFSAGPVPDHMSADTVPNILLEGYYTMKSIGKPFDTKHFHITASWTGRDCWFIDYQQTEGIRPTRDPNVPQPTYTPRPAPIER